MRVRPRRRRGRSATLRNGRAGRPARAAAPGDSACCHRPFPEALRRASPVAGARRCSWACRGESRGRSRSRRDACWRSNEARLRLPSGWTSESLPKKFQKMELRLQYKEQYAGLMTSQDGLCRRWVSGGSNRSRGEARSVLWHAGCWMAFARRCGLATCSARRISRNPRASSPLIDWM
ncbi:hypothetical protein BOSE62_150108 [Bosea sp. 62]|nr:hypothetical protein BOSE29B_10727 [Bosea sp. 29B]VXB68812.1 hypothetical protein BOSE62_150108 [Bosea sp. 62]